LDGGSKQISVNVHLLCDHTAFFEIVQQVEWNISDFFYCDGGGGGSSSSSSKQQQQQAAAAAASSSSSSKQQQQQAAAACVPAGALNRQATAFFPSGNEKT
jgi:hypothetical protein